MFASPLVRKLAGERGVDLAGLAGTGPNGRIVRRDLERFLTAPGARRPRPGPAPPAPPAATTPGGLALRPLPGLRGAGRRSTLPFWMMLVPRGRGAAPRLGRPGRR